MAEAWCETARQWTELYAKEKSPDEKLERLLEMGFPAEVARAALERCGGVDAAVANLESRVPVMLERGGLPLPVSSRGNAAGGIPGAREGSVEAGEEGEKDEEAQRRRERGI